MQQQFTTTNSITRIKTCSQRRLHSDNSVQVMPAVFLTRREGRLWKRERLFKLNIASRLELLGSAVDICEFNNILINIKVTEKNNKSSKASSSTVVNKIMLSFCDDEKLLFSRRCEREIFQQRVLNSKMHISKRVL